MIIIGQFYISCIHSFIMLFESFLWFVTILRYSIFQAAQVVTQNIMMFLPRNVDKNQIEELSWLSSPPLELEVIFILTKICWT